MIFTKNNEFKELLIKHGIFFCHRFSTEQKTKLLSSICLNMSGSYKYIYKQEH